MGAFLSTPFCPYESQRVGLGYLAAECRNTTESWAEVTGTKRLHKGRVGQEWDNPYV
jgi:hypothetical protein